MEGEEILGRAGGVWTTPKSSGSSDGRIMTVQPGYNGPQSRSSIYYVEARARVMILWYLIEPNCHASEELLIGALI